MLQHGKFQSFQIPGYQDDDLDRGSDTVRVWGSVWTFERMQWETLDEAVVGILQCP